MLTQEQIDDRIRQVKGNAAVVRMIVETPLAQQYQLSDGTFLIITKRTGIGRIETASGEILRRF